MLGTRADKQRFGNVCAGLTFCTARFVLREIEGRRAGGDNMYAAAWSPCYRGA
jgi:hypothetical protein